MVVAAGGRRCLHRALAKAENLEAYQVAVVTEDAAHGHGAGTARTIVDLSRAFLNTNGAVKHAGVACARKDRSRR